MPWKSYRKNVPLDVVLLVLKLCPIQVVVSLPLWIKLTMGQLLLFFLCNFSSFFSYVRGIPVTNHFSLLLIDRYILAIQQIITHKEHFRYSFSSELPQKPWHHGHNNRKWLKQLQSHFYWAVSMAKVTIFCCFDVVCSVQPHLPDISSSFKQKYQQYGLSSRLSFRFLWHFNMPILYALEHMPPFGNFPQSSTFQSSIEDGTLCENVSHLEGFNNCSTKLLS